MEIDRETLKYIFMAIRECFKRSKTYDNSINNFLSKSTGPRGGKRFRCAVCNGIFEKKDIEMDHYPEPVVPLTKRWYELTVQEYYDRVFLLNTRSLCKKCHKTHTKDQNKTRR